MRDGLMPVGFGVNQGDVAPQSNLPAFPVSNRIHGVQPNRLENLDDLLAQAEHYADHSMRNIGRLPPTLFLIGSKGPLMFMPESLADESDKDDFATTARLMCIAHAATACVMALEAWAKFAKAGEKFDETEPPSEAFDRQEVVVLMGESHTGQKQKFLPIIRSDNGKFFGLGESECALDGRNERPLCAIAPHQSAGRGNPVGCQGHAQGQRCWPGHTGTRRRSSKKHAAQAPMMF